MLPVTQQPRMMQNRQASTTRATIPAVMMTHVVSHLAPLPLYQLPVPEDRSAVATGTIDGALALVLVVVVVVVVCVVTVDDVRVRVVVVEVVVVVRVVVVVVVVVVVAVVVVVFVVVVAVVVVVVAVVVVVEVQIPHSVGQLWRTCLCWAQSSRSNRLPQRLSSGTP